MISKTLSEKQAHYLGMADAIVDQIHDSMPTWQKAQLRSAADVIRRHFAHRMALSEMCGEEIPLAEWFGNYNAGLPLLDRRRSKMAVEKAAAEFSEQMDALEKERFEPIQIEGEE